MYDALNVQLAAGVLRTEDKFIMPNYECPIFEKTYRDLYKKDIKGSVNENQDLEELESVSELPSPVRKIESPRLKTLLTPDRSTPVNNEKIDLIDLNTKPKFDKQSRRQKILEKQSRL